MLAAALGRPPQAVPSRDLAECDQLLAVARRADPNEWRNRFRDVALHGGREEVSALADLPGVATLPPSTVVLLARALARVNLLAKALDVLHGAQHRYPDDFWLNHELAYWYQHGQPARFQEALGFYRAALAVRPDSAGTHVDAAQVLLRLNKVDEAVTHLRRAVQLKPDYAWGHVLLGSACTRQQAWPEALAALQQATTLKPRDSWVHCNLACALRVKGDLDEAVAAYQEAIRLDPSNPMAHRELGQTFAAKKDWGEAVAEYERAIQLVPAEATNYGLLGTALKARGSLPEAIVAFSKEIELQPKAASAWQARADLHYKLQEYEEAVRDFSRVIELRPMTRAAWQYRGASLVDLGRAEEALGDLSHALELNPDEWSAWYQRGLAYYTLGRWDRAVRDYSRPLEVDPRQALPRNNLAWLLATCPEAKLRDPDRAVRLAKQAVEASPQDADLWNTLGIAQYRTGDWKAVLTTLDESMRLRQGGDAWDWYVLAMTHWQLGSKDEARQWYARARRWVPGPGKGKPRLLQTYLQDMELRWLQREAAELLGLND